MLLQHIKSVRWHPSKQCSNNQKAHLACLNHRTITTRSEKEIISPSPTPTIISVGHLQDELEKEQQRALTYEKHFRDKQKCCTHKDRGTASLQKQLHLLQSSTTEITAEAHHNKVCLDKARASIHQLQNRNNTLTKRN
jgi:septal ring factor EnvC (AmiA/AmiB activator)